MDATTRAEVYFAEHGTFTPAREASADRQNCSLAMIG